MKSQYGESLFPFGIGASFALVLGAVLGLGALTGYLFGGQPPYDQFGGLVLLVVFSAVFVGPLIYNQASSGFQQGRTMVGQYDGLGLIKGLRGVLFRLVVYEDGLEIRAFYHRYFIPYTQVRNFVIEEGTLRHRLDIETGLEGVPEYLVCSDKKFLALLRLMETKLRAGGAGPQGQAT